MIKAFKAILLTGILWTGQGLYAQTVISESGRLLYFNSLDSAQGATLNRFATLTACWLYNFDGRDSFPILLDLRPGADSTDTSSYELGYDNLYGNSLSFPDSTQTPTDPTQQPYYLRLGLRIHSTGPRPDPGVLLRLLEYGIAHYKMLMQIRSLCLSEGAGSDPGPLTLVPQDIARILSRPSSPRIRAVLKICR